MPHYTLLRQSQWIDLPALLAVEQDSPLYNVKSQAPLFYAESWALVHMLYLATTTGPSCAGCWRASRPAPAWRTRSKRHTGSPWSRWKRTSGRIWARNGLMPRCSTRGWRRPASRRPRRRVHSKSALVLAEIVANAQDKAAQGRELYNGLARDNPRDWRIEEGLARLSRRGQKIGEAEQHYARAAELGSTSARMYLDYGRLLRVEDKRAEAAAVLKRATEIDPDDREARLELGYAYVVNDQHAEALAQFQLAKPVAPEHAFEYLHAMAYAYYRLDRKAEAKTTAATCHGYAKTTEQVERLNQLVTALNYESHEPVISEEAPPPPRRPEPMPAPGPVQRARNCRLPKAR